MKIVIDIPEDDYNGLQRKDKFNDMFLSYYEKLIVYGTPLPKGHGRLGDLDKIANEVNALKDNWNRYGNEYESGRYESYDSAVDVIKNSTTIIEGEKE